MNSMAFEDGEDKMSYRVTSWDICVQGFERLRSYTETLLAVPLSPDMTMENIKEALVEDLQICERPEGFNYNKARNVLTNFVERLQPRYKETNPFDVEEGPKDNPVYLFVYLETGIHQSVY